jgi:hypothetical protein
MTYLEDQKKLAIELNIKHLAEIEANNPIAGPWKSAVFVCPDCLTEVTIRTRLPFDHPFRIACPCKYSGMHKATPWEIEEEA